MINIPMTSDGPDMDLVEQYVENDPAVKGIWCVPKYSNPQGITYSDETVHRFAKLNPAAEDFRIFWDNAYGIHHLYEDKQDYLIEILMECKKEGHPNMVYKFGSTSKISFPGSGIAAIAASDENLAEIRKMMSVQTIGHDKLNQLRHARFFGDIHGMVQHMKKHADILRPKFDTVLNVLESELGGLEIGALAWRVSQESFMKPVEKWLSNLKLRVSYGVTGNSGGMGAYSSQTGAATYSPVSIDGLLSSVSQLVSPYGNPSIGWEKTYQWNYGVDLGLFNNRVNVNLDIYNSKTKDLLFSRTLPITSAITAWGSPMTTWQNIGETSNKGYEIQLSTVNIRNKDFEWRSSLSYTHNKEKIVNLPDGDLVAKKLFEGYPIKTFYDYKYAGIWSTAEADEAAKYGCQPGYVKIETVEQFTTDENGNLVGDGGVHTYSNTRDLQILGSNVPDGIVGLNNTFTYKGIELSAFAIIRYGQMIDSKTIGWYSTKNDNQPRGTNYWTPENQNTYFPRPGIASTTGIESLRYIDGSYAKIKNVTLGYVLPKKICKTLGIGKCRVYATAYNVFVLPFKSELKHTDPENNGSDTFPLYKSYLIGLNLSF